MKINFFFTNLIILIVKISCVTLVRKNLFNEISYLNECTINEKTYQVFCYGTPLTSNSSIVSPVFKLLNYSISNRTFASLYFYNYIIIPSSAFEQISLNTKYMNGSDYTNRIYIQITSSTQFLTNLFNPFARKLNNEILQASDVNLDVDLMTPVNPVFSDYAFNETTIKNLYIYDIKKSNSTPFKFNLKSFCGGKRIEKLKFDRCATLDEFTNEGNFETEKKIQIDQIILYGSNFTYLSNLTFDSRIIQVNKIKQLDFSVNRIVKIDAFTFYEMELLEMIDLRSNNLNSIENNMFQQKISNLITLDLSSNPIKTVSLNSFNSLKNLKVLNLRGTQLKSIQDGFLTVLANNLESLDISSIKTLQTYNWESLIRNVKLKTLNLSYLNNTKFIFNSDVDDSLQLSTILNRIDLLKLNGYNFTHQDVCKILFKPIVTQQNTISLMQLDFMHSCNCFVIDIYRLYRINHTITDNQTSKWLDQTPSCYKRLYNLASTSNILTDTLISYEKTCAIEQEAICNEKKTTTEVANTVTTSMIYSSLITTSTETTTFTQTSSSTSTTTSKASVSIDNFLTTKLISTINVPLIVGVSSAVAILITGMLIIAFIYKIRMNYKFQKQLNKNIINSSNFRLENF